MLVHADCQQRALPTVYDSATILVRVIMYGDGLVRPKHFVEECT
jgi:hypothetical protein